MKLIIDPVDNGYVLTIGYSAPEDKPKTLVFEDNDTKRHVVLLLWSILEELGEVGSKHDSERVKIVRYNPQTGEELV